MSAVRRARSSIGLNDPFELGARKSSAGLIERPINRLARASCRDCSMARRDIDLSPPWRGWGGNITLIWRCSGRTVRGRRRCDPGDQMQGDKRLRDRRLSQEERRVGKEGVSKGSYRWGAET